MINAPSSGEEFTMSEIRRLLPRQFADWRGRYMIEGDPTESWRDCRVIDISSAGAGLELLDTSAEEAAGQRILIAVHLRGEIRNSAPKGEALRAGVQFVDLSDAERFYLESLEEIKALW
jgi:hypothetical protein